ncbi:MAG: CPBP family intramembrane metalloprotease [Planctomycetes bacterium]|nr:CPBP family intramembrane metalloprotease [Planctomycetota bacterium]
MRRFLFIYAGMLVVAAVLVRVSGAPSLFRAPETPALLWGPLAAAVALALAVVEAGKRLEGVDWYRRMAEYLRQVLTSPDLLGPRLDQEKALVVAVYSSIAEEALFRGWLQPVLIAALAGRLGEGLAATAAGIVAASLLFGLLHVPMVPELRPWTAFAIVAGLLFGALAAWSGSLLAPIAAHFLINWLNLRRLAALRPAQGPV